MRLFCNANFSKKGDQQLVDECHINIANIDISLLTIYLACHYENIAADELSLGDLFCLLFWQSRDNYRQMSGRFPTDKDYVPLACILNKSRVKEYQTGRRNIQDYVKIGLLAMNDQNEYQITFLFTKMLNHMVK